jgi:hypothetical protein
VNQSLDKNNTIKTGSDNRVIIGALLSSSSSRSGRGGGGWDLSSLNLGFLRGRRQGFNCRELRLFHIIVQALEHLGSLPHNQNALDGEGPEHAHRAPCSWTRQEISGSRSFRIRFRTPYSPVVYWRFVRIQRGTAVFSKKVEFLRWPAGRSPIRETPAWEKVCQRIFVPLHTRADALGLEAHRASWSLSS